jgi:hypothetical protein
MLAFISLADAAAAATAFGVVLAAWALFLQRGQARTQFEDAVVKQYRELIKPTLVLDALLAPILDESSSEERERLRYIYSYLDLCNEQVFLRAIGRVSRSTWKIQWSPGIQGNVEGNEAISQAWGEIQRSTRDFQELRALQQGEWEDPRKWEPIWRRPLVRFGLATLRVPPTRMKSEERPDDSHKIGRQVSSATGSRGNSLP